MTDDNRNFALLSLVAIVAVVGLVVLFMAAGSSPKVAKSTPFAMEAGNVAGNADWWDEGENGCVYHKFDMGNGQIWMHRYCADLSAPDPRLPKVEPEMVGEYK